MRGFVKHIKRICFIGRQDCNQGGNIPTPEEILNGVVNNGIYISNNGVIIVNNGS